MNTPIIFAFGMPGGQEWFLIFLAILLLFGAKKLPEFARGLGRSMGEFRKAKDEFEAELHRTVDETEKPAIKAPEEKRQPVSQES